MRSQMSDHSPISNTKGPDIFEMDEQYISGSAPPPGTRAPVWRQEDSGWNFHNFVYETEAGLTRAWPGVLETVRGLNPEFFQMPWGVSKFGSFLWL